MTLDPPDTPQDSSPTDPSPRDAERCHRCYRALVDGACPSCAQRDDPFESPLANPLATDPSALPLPAEPTGGFTTPAVTPGEASSDLRRVMIWVAIAAMTALYLLLGGGANQGVASATLVDAGQLTKSLFSTFRHDWWRLVLATFLHSGWFILLISALMVWLLGGPAERRAGGGLILFLLVVGGTLLNVLRVHLEPAAALANLAGAWPAGLAMGGASLALGQRTSGPRPRVVGSLVFEAGILLFIAFSGNLFSWGLLLVMGCAVALGLFVGAVWPLDASRGPTGCFITFFSALMLAFAFWGRTADAHRPSAPPVEWRTSNPAEWEAWQEQNRARKWQTPTDLRETPVPDLKLELHVPSGWSQQRLPPTRECPSCEARVELPEEPPEAPEGEKPTVECTSCNEKVRWVKKPIPGVIFREPSLFGVRRQLMVYAWERGPFDDPDTVAQRLVVANSGGFRDPTVQIDQPFESDHMGRGHVIVLRGEISQPGLGGDPTYIPVLMRLYVFVSSDRTVFLRSLDQDTGSPHDWAASGEFFDQVARTVQRHEAANKTKKRKND